MEKFICNNRYIVYCDGRVWSVKRNRFLNFAKHPKGYLRMRIDKKQHMVHRIIAECFIPNPDNLPEVNHKNMDKTDNRVENLEWCTSRQNKQHQVKSVKQFFGVRHHKQTDKYQARVWFNNRNNSLGYFNTPEEAHNCYVNYINTHNL